MEVDRSRLHYLRHEDFYGVFMEGFVRLRRDENDGSDF